MSPLVTFPELTQAQKKAQSIEQKRANAINQFQNSIKEIFNDFWYPTDGVTPQEIADIFGTKTGAAFDAHADAIQFLLSQGVDIKAEDYIPPKQYDRNPDDSITIIE